MLFYFKRSLAFACLTLNASCIAKSTYSIVDGYFIQNDPSIVAREFDFMKHNFGLKHQPDKPREQTDWQYLTSKLTELNAASPAGTSYKLLFIGRHARGLHESAMEWYGRKWKKMRYKDGNGTVTWADAHLEQSGIDQANAVGKYWASQLSIPSGAPAPQSYYTSPQYRCLQTINYTFGNLHLPISATPFIPTIKENLREHMGIATYGKRSSRSYIQNSFPGFEFELGFTELDTLWKPKEIETWDQMDWRVKIFLDDLFMNDGDSQVVSLTTHLGTVLALLRVVGHRKFSLNDAQVIPVLVKGVLEQDGDVWSGGETGCGEFGCRDVYWV